MRLVLIAGARSAETGATDWVGVDGVGGTVVVALGAAATVLARGGVDPRAGVEPPPRVRRTVSRTPATRTATATRTTREPGRRRSGGGTAGPGRLYSASGAGRDSSS